MRRVKLSGHQTFPLRYGWIEKGYRFADEGGRFSSADAVVALGVGKNMVAGIEYWCRLAGILDADGAPTALARRLLDERTGWDPFLEQDASWWLLHWNVATNPESFTSASALFSLLRRTEFSKAELSDLIARTCLASAGKAVSPAVLDRDVDCFVRSYHARPTARDSADGSFECPFQELRLVEPLPSEAGSFRFNVGPKHSLPPHVVGYALWDMLRASGGGDGLRLQEALYGEYGPGQVFMLDEGSLVDAVLGLREDARLGDRFDVSESAGIARIRCSVDDGLGLLDAFYSGD